MWSRDREGLDQVRIVWARVRGGWIGAGLLFLTSGIAASATAQSVAGQTVYQDACAECHRSRLQGGVHGPALTGVSFSSVGQSQRG